MEKEQSMNETEEFEFRRRREQEVSATPEPAVSTVKGLPDFQSTGGGAAVGNPYLKANNPKPESNVPYEVGGTVTDVMSKAGASPEVSAAGGTAANFLTSAVPALLGVGATGPASQVVGAAAKSGATGLMQSALKPTWAMLKTGKAERAAQTMLDEGINATNGGVNKLNGMIDELGNNVSQALEKSGATVDKSKVASRIQDVVGRVEKSNPTPQDALADVEKVYNQFLSNGLLPEKIPIARAQQIKQGIYQMLREKYGQLGSDTVEAQKALARGLKEEIEAAAPSVSPLNARASELINARNVAERRALMEGNKNPMGGLTFLTHSPELALGHYANGSAFIKSMLARGLYSGGQPMSQILMGGGIAEELARRNQ